MKFGNKNKAAIKVYHFDFETFAVVAHQQETYNITIPRNGFALRVTHILLNKSISRQAAENEITLNGNEIFITPIFIIKLKEM